LFAIAEFPLAWMSRRTVVVNSDDGRFYERCCRRERVVLAPAGGAGVNVQLSAGDRRTRIWTFWLVLGSWPRIRRRI
jgi:hypothetical protein